MTRSLSLTPEGYMRARRLLMRRDPLLAAVIREIGPCGMAGRQNPDHLGTLVRAVIGQQLSAKAAATIHARFLALLAGGRVTVDGLAGRDEGNPPVAGDVVQDAARHDAVAPGIDSVSHRAGGRDV